MNEADTRAEWIEPLLKAAGWGVVKNSKIQREFPIIQKAKVTGKPDYLLVFNNIKLAIIEAKRLDLRASAGVSQAKNYAEKLHIRFIYATNGKAIYQIDLKTGKEGEIAQFPSPQELWQYTFTDENPWRDRFAQIPFENKSGSWEIRYYQEVAIQRILEAIAQGQSRILLTLATGTGKTAIAFQVAWKLFHSRWNLKKDQQRRPRILFLADRNILADQAYNAFSAFPDDAIIRIKPEDIRKKGKVPTNGNIFLTIFQTFMSGKMPYFGEYPADFFDLVIIDECHRGGADDESSWREILNYFSPAVQLGLTATPKRQDNVDTYDYFGEPVYRYSLKEGINDGFLTPFKIRQIQTTLDEYLYAPDDEVLEGNIVEGKIYQEADFNQKIEIEAREAKRVQIFMEAIDKNEKTLVFCANQSHALLIRDLINQTKQSSHIHYCERVTADEGELGEQFLRDFQDNEKIIPTILTTSRKLSTGVDARNVRNIVLLRPIKSMIEFKQIIGRGTRLYDGKDYFTIYDFVKASLHFEDPAWDGEPLDKTIEQRFETPLNPLTQIKAGKNEDEAQKAQKVIVRLAEGKERLIQYTASTSFWSAEGRPLSTEAFLQRLFGELPHFFKSEAELIRIWSQPATRKDFLAKIAELGYDKEQLQTLQKMIDADKSDLYDVLAHIAFGKTPISRVERVAASKDHILAQVDEKQGIFLDFVLDQYIEMGVEELDQDKLPGLLLLKYHTFSDATEELGEVETIREVFAAFQPYLYEKPNQSEFARSI